jgi:hypothetical protein
MVCCTWCFLRAIKLSHSEAHRAQELTYWGDEATPAPTVQLRVGLHQGGRSNAAQVSHRYQFEAYPNPSPIESLALKANIRFLASQA